MSQRKYVLDLLKETRMGGCRPAETPIDLNLKFVKEGKLIDKGQHQRLVGKLIYFSHTRPDISFVVSLHAFSARRTPRSSLSNPKVSKEFTWERVVLQKRAKKC